MNLNYALVSRNGTLLILPLNNDKFILSFKDIEIQIKNWVIKMPLIFNKKGNKQEKIKFFYQASTS